MDHGDLKGAVLDGRYRVIEPIAEGAMGVVYRAERIKLGRIVAVKVLHDQLPTELSSRKRFEIEATAMAKLEHPHCAAVLDVGVHEDKPYVVMDFVSGTNLKDVIAQGPLPIPRAVELVRQVLSGLAHAHEHGIIHRDIKPANVVLSQKAGLGDHVKILDFGLARLSADASNLTTGIVVGTPAYMAPEQIRGAPIDHRADLYACGVLLFELLTGNKPFVSPEDDPIEVCTMHLKTPPPRLADLQPGIAFGELEAVVAKALAKQAADRYSTAEQFAEALDVVLPRKRVETPIAGIAVSGSALASPSGWAVPPESSAPVSVHGSPTHPAPAGAAPPAGPSIAVGSDVTPGYAPAAGLVAGPPIAAGSDVTPGYPPVGVAAAFSPVADSAPAAARPSLPPDFDLSLAIPREGQTPAQAPEVPDVAEAPVVAESAPDLKETVAFLGAPPAGPSPLGMPDAAAIPEPPVDDGLSRPQSSLPFTHKQLAIAGGGVLLLILVIAIIASSSGSPKVANTDDAGRVVTQEPGEQDPADHQIERANEMVAAGRRDAAIDHLLAARKVFPDHARIAYVTGKLYFGKRWWTVGLRHLRDAIRLDSGFRSDPELIQMVLEAYGMARDYHAELGAFVRKDLGEAVRPYLEEIAKTHKHGRVRARAAAELRRL